MLQSFILIGVALFLAPQAVANQNRSCDEIFLDTSVNRAPDYKINEQVLITYKYRTRRTEGTHYRVLTVSELHRDARDNIVSFYGLDAYGKYHLIAVDSNRIGRTVNQKSDYRVNDLVGWYKVKFERQGRVRTLVEGRISNLFDTGTAIVEGPNHKISFVRITSLIKRLGQKQSFNGLVVGTEVMRVQSMRTRRAVIKTVYRGYVTAMYADGAIVIENDMGARDSGPAENYYRVEN